MYLPILELDKSEMTVLAGALSSESLFSTSMWVNGMSSLGRRNKKAKKEPPAFVKWGQM